MTFTQRNHPSVLGITANISVQDLLDQTNKKRQENGVGPLTMDSQLVHAAQMKAEHMFAHNYWAHVAPDGTTPWVFIKNAGYEYLYAGENLARGFTTAPDTVNAWMASPSHRENLLSPNLKEIGFAVKSGTLTGTDTILVVQTFGSKYIGQGEVATAEIAPVIVTPIISLSPTPAPKVKSQAEVLPTSTPAFEPTAEPTPVTIVAAIQNNPLIDSKSAQRNIGMFVLIFFIVIFALDAIIIERKKIARLVSHNADHMIFLSIILIAAIIIGKGLIL